MTEAPPFERFVKENHIDVIQDYPIKLFSSIIGKKCIFLFNDTTFTLYNPKKDNAIAMFPWMHLKSISTDKNKIILTFKEPKASKADDESEEQSEFIIASAESNEKSIEIKQEICDLLQKVLTPKELKKIEFSNMNQPHVFPTVRSPYARYRMWKSIYRDKEDFITDELTNKVICSFSYTGSYLNLGELPHIEQIFPMYLDLLTIAPQIEELRIPMIPTGKVYEPVTKLVASNYYLKYLEINGKVSKKFPLFLRSLKDNKYSQISSLSFVHSDFKVDDLELLYQFIINNSSIRALELHSALPPETMDFFYSSFLTPQLFDHLALLNLDRSYGTNLDKLLPKLRNLTMLSLACCDLDLGEVLNSISKYSLLNLQILNLSGCIVKTVPNEDLPQFNKNFKKLVLNHVSWPSNTLIPFFKFFMSHFRNPNSVGPSLCMAHQTASNEEWLQLFDYLSTVNDYQDLVELNWSNNPVNVEFIDFLSKNTKLAKLSMSGCFSERNPDVINRFCEFLSSSRVKFLTISGNEVNHFGRFTAKVVNSLVNSKTLQLLDVSNSYGKNEAIKELISLLETASSLNTINFDGLYPDTSDEFVSMMNTFIQYQESKKISFPRSDIRQLNSSRALSVSNGNELARKYKFSYPVNPPFTQKQKRSSNMEPSMPAPNPTLTKNFMIYEYHATPDFPYLITEEDFVQIKKSRKAPAVLSTNPEEEEQESTQNEEQNEDQQEQNVEQQEHKEVDEEPLQERSVPQTNENEEPPVQHKEPAPKTRPKFKSTKKKADAKKTKKPPPQKPMTEEEVDNEALEFRSVRKLPKDIDQNQHHHSSDEEDQFRSMFKSRNASAFESPTAQKSLLGGQQDPDSPFQLPPPINDAYNYAPEWTAYNKKFALNSLYTSIVKEKD